MMIRITSINAAAVGILAAMLAAVKEPITIERYLRQLQYANNFPKENLTATVMIQRLYPWISTFKFHQVDIRVIARDKDKAHFMKKFMEPPLYEVHTEVQSECDRGFAYCLLLIYNMSQPSYQWRVPYDRFRARATAMYYLCWFTMMEEKTLLHFGSHCPVPPALKDQLHYQTLRSKYYDYRDMDVGPFDCALLHFCPDPCCGQIDDIVDRTPGLLLDPSDCSKHRTNPCLKANVSCYVDRERNRNFAALAMNRFNTTCDCATDKPGFVYNSKVEMCVDIDECSSGNFECEKNSICRNLAGSYYCTCRLGFKFNGLDGCIGDKDFEFDESLVAQVEKVEEIDSSQQKSVSLNNLFEFLLLSAASSTMLSVHLAVCCCAFWSICGSTLVFYSSSHATLLAVDLRRAKTHAHIYIRKQQDRKDNMYSFSRAV